MNGAKISDGSPQSRPPACEAALKMEGEAELSCKNWLKYAYLSAIRDRHVEQNWLVAGKKIELRFGGNFDKLPEKGK